LVLDDLISQDLVKKFVNLFQDRISKTSEEQGTHWTNIGYVFKENKILHKIQGVATIFPELKELINLPEIVTKVQDLIQSDNLHVFGTKFFPMLPGQTSVSWHQDNYYFGTQSDKIVTIGIYLEPSSVSNGCLRVVPGSHKLNVENIPHSLGTGIWSQGEWIEYEHILSLYPNGAIDVPVTVPGTVVFFSSLLIHSAYHNLSENLTRYSLFWHYIDSELNFKWRDVDFSYGVYADRHSVSTAIDK